MSILKPLFTANIEIFEDKFIEVDYYTEEELFEWFDSSKDLPKSEFIEVLDNLNDLCIDDENYEVCSIIKKYKENNGLQ